MQKHILQTHITIFWVIKHRLHLMLLTLRGWWVLVSTLMNYACLDLCYSKWKFSRFKKKLHICSLVLSSIWKLNTCEINTKQIYLIKQKRQTESIIWRWELHNPASLWMAIYHFSRIVRPLLVHWLSATAGNAQRDSVGCCEAPRYPDAD